MFEASLKTDYRDTLKRRERVSRALEALKHKDSEYAQEHRDLIAYLDDVLETQTRHLNQLTQ